MDLFENKNISPMLLYQTEPFDDENYIFELKLDGIRCLAYIDKESVVLHNKRYKDVTNLYPELKSIYKCIKKRCILDGELVCMINGKPNFYELQKRSMLSNDFKISILNKKNPIQFVAYDILYLGNDDVTNLPLLERKKLLKQNVKEGYNLSISRYIETKGKAYFELVKEQGLEGIVAKKKDGKYYIGKRTREWLKIKVMKDEDLIICGYQVGENEEIRSVILGAFDELGLLICKGKVSLGISKDEAKFIKLFAKKHTIKTPWFAKYKNVVWLKLELIATVEFMDETKSGGMRQPVWKGLRSDKSIKDCIEH
ncbi:MAG: ATP-dependent DNA ligase [Christensenellales bacterium]